MPRAAQNSVRIRFSITPPVSPFGIIVAQRLLPEAFATASAIFMCSTAIASALYGLTATIGIATMSQTRHAVR